MEVLRANVYDYPRYYDLVYGSDWKAEFDFLCGSFQRYARGGAAGFRASLWHGPVAVSAGEGWLRRFGAGSQRARGGLLQQAVAATRIASLRLGGGYDRFSASADGSMRPST